MPTKRTKRGARLLLELTPRRASYLRAGSYLLAGPTTEDFVDDAEVEQAWQMHREAILSKWDRPGRRPWAFWWFDLDLEQLDYRAWRWPAPYVSEADCVRGLLLAGKLEPCQRDGTIVINSEAEAIEAEWDRSRAYCTAHHPGDPIERALRDYGVPRDWKP
jgi:hypothetical protein